MSINYQHQSVMANEVMAYFTNCSGKILVDATAGGGGHLAMLAEAVGAKGRVLAFDQDPRAHEEDASLGVARRYTNIKLFRKPFSQIKNTLAEEGIEQIDGLLCDLGVSSNQLDDDSRGFSFMADGPIDMRMDPSTGMTAYEWLASTSEEQIANALFQLGGEKKSRAIAKKIKTSWPIQNSTTELARLILSAMKQRNFSKAHPATRSFQAIRMSVNHEVDELQSLLNDVPDLLAVNGIAAFLSFHSVEDRMIKTAFRNLAGKFTDGVISKQFGILTKKPITASTQELQVNRRSRSAKLRALMRVS